MIRHAPSALAAVLVLGLAAPAGAACSDDIAELEERVTRLKSAPESQETEPVQVQTENGEVTVGASEGGEEPQENWFGSPPSEDNAAEQLDNARMLAEQGDEAGCGEHVNDAREIIEALED